MSLLHTCAHRNVDIDPDVTYHMVSPPRLFYWFHEEQASQKTAILVKNNHHLCGRLHQPSLFIPTEASYKINDSSIHHRELHTERLGAHTHTHGGSTYLLKLIIFFLTRSLVSSHIRSYHASYQSNTSSKKTPHIFLPSRVREDPPHLNQPLRIKHTGASRNVGALKRASINCEPIAFERHIVIIYCWKQTFFFPPWSAPETSPPRPAPH